MTKRKAISKRVRFEVFKRDGFKCQYCGKAAPDVILHLDHISPVSKGGKADILNLVTACEDCNSGKSNVELSDDSAIKKQRNQLEELNVRREQLEMMLKWREGMAGIADQSLEAISSAWENATPGYHLNDTGLKTARQYFKKYGLQSVLDAIDVAGSRYIQINEGGEATKESVESAWYKVGGILRMGALPEWKRDLYYIRGILRNRLAYVNERLVMQQLQEAIESGISTDWLKEEARTSRTWTQFEADLLREIQGAKDNG